MQNSNSPKTTSEIGLLALSFQEEFGAKAYSSASAEKLLKGKLNIEIEQPNGDSYLLSDLTQANELFKLKVLARLKDFDVLSKLEPQQLSKINKEEWEIFLKLYSILEL